MYSNEWGGKMKKRIGIYHYQYYRGACKLCYRHFIQEMVESYEKCHEVGEEIYGKENCEFLHYTDFGQYDSPYHGGYREKRTGCSDVLWTKQHYDQ